MCENYNRMGDTALKFFIMLSDDLAKKLNPEVIDRQYAF